MKVESRSYSTQFFRPTPVIYSDEEKQYLIVATSWGLREHAEYVIEEMRDYIQSSISDVEVTSPFEFIPSLNREANILRISLLITNLKLAKQFNGVEYQAGVEAVVLHKKGNILSWAAMGLPEIYLTHGHNLVPLEVNASIDSTPLPKQMLGLDTSIYPRCNQMHLKDQDQVLLLSRSLGANDLIQISGGWQVDSIASHLAIKQPDIPFWLGLVSQ